MHEEKDIKRVFASFGGKCPFNCLHCYTFSKDFKMISFNDIDAIVKSIKHDDFNIVYVSGFIENFIIPQKGIDLLLEIYRNYRCDILFTTRNVFEEESIARLSLLNKEMNREGHKLYGCVSISAYESYKRLETAPLIPSPQKRIGFIKQLFNENIITFLTLRPVFPSYFIPTEEYIRLIKECEKQYHAIISSGIVVNKTILERLKKFDYSYNKQNEVSIMKCLNQDQVKVNYVNVNKELKMISDYCTNNSIKLFSGSIEAICNYDK